MLWNSNEADTFYVRLERLWLAFRSEGSITPGGWRSDDTGTSDTDKVNLSVKRRGDILYGNYMEHNPEKASFFVIHTCVGGNAIDIDIYPDHVSARDSSIANVEAIVEDFLQTHGAY
ncbi:MAG TPA: hypothetical protein VFT59_04600 [Candidatus Saccharimonadales bacterium]|nr:hypothetical protein [Candidatus Saccharimonadales bacterium]